MYHVLTVDDSRTMRETLALTLRSAGFKVSSANDGAAALALAQAEHFALGDDQADIAQGGQGVVVLGDVFKLDHRCVPGSRLG